MQKYFKLFICLFCNFWPLIFLPSIHTSETFTPFSSAQVFRQDLSEYHPGDPVLAMDIYLDMHGKYIHKFNKIRFALRMQITLETLFKFITIHILSFKMHYFANSLDVDALNSNHITIVSPLLQLGIIRNMCDENVILFKTCLVWSTLLLYLEKTSFSRRIRSNKTGVNYQ